MKCAVLIILLSSFFLSCNKKPSFDKIIFHTTGCFGSCPTYHLELDSDKKVKLFAEHVFKGEPFNVADTGHFIGNADEHTFKLLSGIIDTVGVETLKFDGSTGGDGSLYTIIIYRNGKRRYLQSMFPPAKAASLIFALYDICENSKLARSAKPFFIERAGLPKIYPRDVKFPPREN
jgi:hypothetical protein